MRDVCDADAPVSILLPTVDTVPGAEARAAPQAARASRA